jgi:electron transport complex protein RnfC
LRRLTPATNIVLAVGQDGIGAELADMDARIVPAVYPSSLDPLVIQAVTGKERPIGVHAVGLHEIWKLGRVAQSGLPVAETVLTLHGVNYLAALGTPAKDLLEHAGIALQDGDALIFNGPLRGVAQSRPDVGVDSQTYGICVIRGDETPPLEGDAPCIACGECVQICPARIQPDLLSRYAELEKDDKCRALHIEACLDCGLCTYVCPARRPVLQYLRLARRRLGA